MAKRKAETLAWSSASASVGSSAMAKPAAKQQRTERLELTTAISNIANVEEKFISAVEHLKLIGPSILRSLDLEIEAKKFEVDRLEEEFQRTLKDGQIRTDQQLAEYRYNGAVDILKERCEVPICATELLKLKESLQELKTDRSEELEALKKEERATSAKQLAIAITNSDLMHKAEIAEKAASVNQQAKEIETLHSTIENLRHELSEQRKLTKEVAEAAKSAPIHLNSGSGR